MEDFYGEILAVHLNSSPDRVSGSQGHGVCLDTSWNWWGLFIEQKSVAQLYFVFASKPVVWQHSNEATHHFDCLTSQNLGDQSKSEWAYLLFILTVFLVRNQGDYSNKSKWAYLSVSQTQICLQTRCSRGCSTNTFLITRPGVSGAVL